jgi:glycosyltransferase involved in cell wall biosynthesis
MAGPGGMAILHEWIDAYAGSEQVFEALAQAFPAADLFALSQEPGVELDTGGRPIRTTILDRPGLRQRRNATLPVMPLAWRTLGSAKYDLALSSHHAFAHTNRLARGGVHLSYVHSPARYVWSPEIDGRGAAWYLGPARAALQGVDRRAARQVTAYAANSQAVADRIAKFWQREAVVISPPVRVEYFGAATDATGGRDYLLGVGRWITYKNLHLVAEVADRLGMPAKIAGRGPDRERIIAAAAAARVPVEVIESPGDDQLRELYRNAACLIFPTVEDFGMVPVEAQAAGTPVAALASGGALETVSDGVSGAFAADCSVEALVEATQAALGLAGDGPRKNAAQFSHEAFRGAIQNWVRSYRSTSI